MVDKLDTVNLEKGRATKVVFFKAHISVFSLHNEAGTREMVSNYSTLRDPFLSHSNTQKYIIGRVSFCQNTYWFL